MTKKYYKKNQGPTVLEIIVVGIFKALWFLITLPFKKRNKKSLSQKDGTEIRKKVDEISLLLNSENEYELRHAVMEADKLVDHVLKLKNYSGNTFADRLRSAEQYMDHDIYQAIWEGHKVRNQLAHEHNSNIKAAELRRAINNLLQYIRQF